MTLPRARRDDLLTTELDDEVVVYDPERKQAHCLNRTAVAVWHHCDGANGIADLQQLVSDEIGVPLDERGLWLALRKLERAHLLVDKLEPDGITRRLMLGKTGRFAGAALAVPILVSVLVPTAAAAASTGDAIEAGDVKRDERDDVGGERD
jgi:hypothetical protein